MRAILQIVVCAAVSVGAAQAKSGLIEPAVQPENDYTASDSSGFDWRAATEQSFFFLTFQNAFRLTQEKTVRELDGPFFRDYWRSVKGLKGWEDGDGAFTNYVAHPMQGAVSGYIQIQNDPRGAKLQFSADPAYWRSRLKATGWAALYSTQFELGLYSEASIGNVGMRPGTMGYVDLVITPVGGFGWMIGEDALDRFFVEPMERNWENRGLTRFLRMALPPHAQLRQRAAFRDALETRRPPLTISYRTKRR